MEEKAWKYYYGIELEKTLFFSIFLRRGHKILYLYIEGSIYSSIIETKILKRSQVFIKLDKSNTRTCRSKECFSIPLYQQK